MPLVSSSVPTAARAQVRGFTLIELLVVITVLAILAGLAGPGMGSLITAQRVRSVAGDLHLTLVRARSEAIKRNMPVTINRTGTSWSSGWSIADPADSTAPALYAVPAAASGVTVTDSPATSQIVYRPNGRAQIALGQQPHFVVAAPAGGSRRCVAIDLTGRPYVKDLKESESSC